jgi:prolyl 4-hydroxylase
LRPSDVIDSKTGEQKISDGRVSETAWWRPDQMDLILLKVFRRIVGAFDGDVRLAESMNVVRYRPGGIFRAHVDAYPSHATGQLDETARSTTTIVYLNEGYQGGETAFIHPKLKITGITGDFLHFRNLTPSGEVDPASVHAGMPVTSGEKWVLVQWVRKGCSPVLK